MSRKNSINDIICSSIFLLLGVAILIITPITTMELGMDDLGSRFFPMTIGCAFIVISLLLGIPSVLAALRDKDSFAKYREGFRNNLRNNLRVIAFCFLLVLSVFFIHKVHFLLGAFTLTTSMLVLCKERKILRYAVVYACTLLAYCLFVVVLHVRI